MILGTPMLGNLQKTNLSFNEPEKRQRNSLVARSLATLSAEAEKLTDEEALEAGDATLSLLWLGPVEGPQLLWGFWHLFEK